MKIHLDVQDRLKKQQNLTKKKNCKCHCLFVFKVKGCSESSYCLKQKELSDIWVMFIRQYVKDLFNAFKLFVNGFNLRRHGITN